MNFVCVWGGGVSVPHLIRINYLYRFRVGRALWAPTWWTAWCWKVMRSRWWTTSLPGGSATWSTGSDTRTLNWWTTTLWTRCSLKVNTRSLYWLIKVHCHYCYPWKLCWGSQKTNPKSFYLRTSWLFYSTCMHIDFLILYYMIVQ